MKRNIKKPLSLASETVRTLDVGALEPVVGGAFKATVLNYGKGLLQRTLYELLYPAVTRDIRRRQ